MSAPIDRLFDQAKMVCTVCGAGQGKCDCWTECACGWSYRKGESCRNVDCTHSGPRPPVVTLQCPRCRRSQRVAREPNDPPRTVTIRIECPECVQGEPDAAPTYFDAAGEQIL
jgi:hypothetical protein